MKRSFHGLLFVVAACVTGPARADFYIVAHASSPQPALSRKEAVDMFMGRTRAFANGDYLIVFDLPRDSPQRGAFYEALTGMGLAEINSYWARLMFSGQSMPPQSLPDELAMLNIVKRNPNALGWVSKQPIDKQVKVLLVLKDPP